LAWIAPLVGKAINWYNNGVKVAGQSLIIDIAIIIQSTGMLVLFCFNERTLKQFVDKFPISEGIFWNILFIRFVN